MREQKADQDERTPEILADIWDVFLDLHRRRRSGLAGPEPISDSELQAWQLNFQTGLEPWEVRLVFDLDVIYRESRHDRPRDT